MSAATRDWNAFDEERRRARSYDPTTAFPYRDAARAYREAGYAGVLWLPARDKNPPPTGFTGEDGRDPDDGLVERWRHEHPEGNVGLRLPKGKLGIDVDQYGEYRGAERLAELEAALGPLPPVDRTSARGPDNPGGIRTLTVPEGLVFPGDLGPGIQLIQWSYRYIVAPPSVHPDGGRYTRYGPTGKVYNQVKPLDAAPSLPEAWVRHFGSRPKAKRKASAGAPRLTDADVLDAIDGMAAGDPCPPVAERRDQALADCDGASGRARHDAVVGGAKNHVMWLVRRGEEGHTGVPGALDAVRARFIEAVAPDRSKGADEAAAEFERALKGAVKQVYADPTAETDKGCCGPRPGAAKPGTGKAEAKGLWTPPLASKAVDDGFWDRSGQLANLSSFALDRMVSRWGMLGCVLAFTAAKTGPHVVLPGPPARASLNLLVGLVAASGGGKTATVEATMDFLLWIGADVPMHELGTGQGIESAYTQPVTKGAPVQFCESALFTNDEVGSMKAHAEMSGSKLLAVIKQAYSGSQLGSRYAAKDKRRPVLRHSYRFALVSGIQPRHADVILDDLDGGFPQRWLWLPAEEPDAPAEPEFEAFGELLKVPKRLAAQEPDEVEGVRRRPEIEIGVFDVARKEVREHRDQTRRGVGDPLRGHQLLTQLKAAALLSVWHGRDEVDEWAWETARQVMAVSDLTRDAVITHQRAEHTQAERRRSARAAAQAVDTDAARQAWRIRETAIWIANKVHADPDRWTATLLKRSGSPVRREWLDDGLDHAKTERWIVEASEPGQGTDKRSLRPGKRRPPKR